MDRYQQRTDAIQSGKETVRFPPDSHPAFYTTMQQCRPDLDVYKRQAYYLIAPEVELNHGYCDLFLMPDLIRYDVKHSYIIELKYLSVKRCV